MVRVKICGITSIDEARIAELSGADAIGMLVGQVHTSPDFIEPYIASEISRSLPPFIVSVLVTHLEKPKDLIRLANQVPCPVIQLHSDLSPSILCSLHSQLSPRKIIGKVSVEGEEAITRAKEIEQFVDAIVLDSLDSETNRVGGTGLVHDWSISTRIVSASRVPIILAGGLTPENVSRAIVMVKPWGVDVNSGVETPDGRKDRVRISQFIAAVRKVS
jgi:phosphoribosylanthranilate isomerase